MRKLLILTPLCILPTACRLIDGSGVSATESREPGAFNAVSNETLVEVGAVFAGEQSVVLTCDDNLLEYIRTEVEGGELRISTDVRANIRPNVDCIVEITTPTLRSLSSSGSGETWAVGAFPDLAALSSSGSGGVEASGGVFPLQDASVSGSGDLYVSAVDSDCLTLDSSGSGTVVAAGEVGCAMVNSSGSGGIEALDLRAVEAEIRVSGSGDVSLTVTGHAEVDISGSGDVRLAGGATVDSDTSGSGELIQL